MDLTEFLRARYDEDEAVARTAIADDGVWFSRYPELPDCHMAGEFGWSVSGPAVETEDSEWGKGVADHIARHDPARVLAEVAAHRRIVEDRSFRESANPSRLSLFGERVLGNLASVYADHPDYDPNWAPAS